MCLLVLQAEVGHKSTQESLQPLVADAGQKVSTTAEENKKKRLRLSVSINEKPSIIPGCPGSTTAAMCRSACIAMRQCLHRQHRPVW